MLLCCYCFHWVLCSYMQWYYVTFAMYIAVLSHIIDLILGVSYTGHLLYICIYIPLFLGVNCDTQDESLNVISSKWTRVPWRHSNSATMRLDTDKKLMTECTTHEWNDPRQHPAGTRRTRVHPRRPEKPRNRTRGGGGGAAAPIPASRADSPDSRAANPWTAGQPRGQSPAN